MAESRPTLSRTMCGRELRRWYWTLAELTALARELGLPRAGGKAVLTERIAAALDGAPAPVPARRGPAGRQLVAPVSGATVIPAGQRCSEVVRAFLREEIGPTFTFDGFMRDFIAAGAGRTLGDAVAHWHITRAEAERERPIGAQFELNAFLRARRHAHPGESRSTALAAWRVHRALPVELRPHNDPPADRGRG